MSEEKKDSVVSKDLIIAIPCAANEKTGCNQVDNAPAMMHNKILVPIHPAPYICLACWRAGWRKETKDSHLYKLNDLNKIS